MRQRNKPPKWILWLLGASVLIWPLVVFWLANSYSGWSHLKRFHDAGSRALINSQGPTNVTLVRASGRKYDFASRHAGRATWARTDVGFDDQGFWVRGRYGGWTGGPRGAVFIPWASVARCHGLRVELREPSMALIIHDQPLLDACVCAVSGGC